MNGYELVDVEYNTASSNDIFFKDFGRRVSVIIINAFIIFN